MSRFFLTATFLTLPLLITTNPAAIAQISVANDGTGTIIEQQGQTFNISGGSLSGDGSNLFHNFADFNLDASQIATFLSTPNLQNILSRISGGNPSYINGLLQVSGGNANLFLLNPSGIVFGNNAQLNLAGDFTASTASGIGFGEEFWTGSADYTALIGTPTKFTFTGNGAIVNAGDLAVSSGRSLNLFASNVVNTGTLAAAGGNVQIMAVPGTNTLRLNQTGQILGLEFAAPTNNLAITDLPQLLTGSNLDTGLIVTNSAVTLAADQTAISSNSGSTFVHGGVDVSGDQGGTIGVFGQAIALNNATINASGTNNGGEILVGGDYQGQGDLFRATTTTIDSNSALNASANATGSGGKIIVWADNATQFSGTALATGGSQSGDGGLVETSGKNYLDIFGSKVNASAVNGLSGQWLLDPSDINIATGGSGTLSGGIFDPATVSTIDPATIVAALDSNTNVIITTSGGAGGNGDITLNNSINQTGGGAASLTITGRLFNVGGGSQIIMNSTGGLTFNINAVNVGTATALDLGVSIQDAHDAIGAVSGTRTINLGAGTFQRGAAINLSKQLTINGGGQGVTILDGSIGGDRVLSTATGGGNDITINNLTIQNGSISDNGGGIANTNGTLNLVNITVANNSANITANGGGINNANGAVNLINSTVSGNNATDRGGGINNNGGTITLTNSIVSGNTTNSGGGIGSNGGTVNVIDSTISGNNAADRGGGIDNNGGTVTLTNSTISGNTVSADRGGGIENSGGGIATLTNSTVSGNTASNSGGGISNNGGAVITLTNSTISDNVAATAGGIYNNGGTVDLTNTIVANSGGGDVVNSFGSINVQGVNIVEDGSFAGVGVLNVDPGLTALGDFGGSTQTHFFDFNQGISPAIDAGNNGVVSGLTAEQRGGNRFVDTVDIGAVEFQGTTLTVVSGGNQAISASTPFAPIVISAQETTFNTILPGLTVNFDAPASGASTNSTGLSGVTDASGQAAVTPTANAEPGSFALTATAFKSGGGASANLTIEPGATEPTEPTEPDKPDEPEIAIDPLNCFPNCIENDLQQSTELRMAEAETNIAEIRRTLKNIADQTGVNPAIVYVYFPDEGELDGARNKQSKAKEKGKTEAIAQWEFSGDRLSDFLNAENRFLEPDRQIRGDTPLRLVMVTPEGQVMEYRVPGATYAMVMREAKNFIRGVTNPRFGNVHLTPAQHLYDVIIRPLEADLDKKRIDNIAFVMDEGLRVLPIAALHDGEQFLVEKYSVGLMPSFSLTNTSAYVAPTDNQLIAMGASEFDGAIDLPAAPLEVQIIGNEIWDGDIFLDDEFTVANLVAARKRTTYGIVHLATHGAFLPGQQDNSYIQFQDQKVSFSDLAKLGLDNPPIELLVLSACRTALGDRQAELGFAGLALTSGAKSALGSIWDVSDAGTMALMTQFYKELKTSPIKAEALRQAQIAMLRGDVRLNGNELETAGANISLQKNNQDSPDQDLTHPYFWSGFTLVGNPW
ncbi:MAG: CHAT domain-containing protein [Limnothrix sp.]